MLALSDVKKSYIEPGGGRLPILDIASCRVAAGEQMVLIGRSGCGKSTLLYVIAGITTADAGKIVIDGSSPNSGIIRDGARMETDVLMHVVVSGAELISTGFANPWIEADQTYITLVLDGAHAGWSMAAAVAQPLFV